MPLSPTVTLARELIRCESVTPRDAGCQDLLAARLRRAGFECEAMEFEGVRNLWATRAAAKPPAEKPPTPKPTTATPTTATPMTARPLVVFAGHTDVVPPGPLAEWRFPPFQGEVADGMLHGRGAADMKGAVASFVTACERFTARHPQHAGALGLLITGDEEGPARFGTREVMRVLQQREVQIDMCIVGEPSGVAALGDVIKVGRRGSLGAIVRIRGKQGHIAYPIDNPIHRAAGVISELCAIKWDDGTANFPPTSFQVSNLHAGAGAANVIPGEAVVEFNLRYSPQSNSQSIRARIEETLARHHAEYAIEWMHSGLPFECADGKLIAAVSDCVEAATGARPAKSTGGGTSDGRFIAPSGAEVVELGPLNATIHQIDECVSIADLDKLSLIYERVLERLLT
ncbi:MAG: succinyl-diaminopimelate desuccinylase [Gammaproteobacteria bacterium]